MMKKYLFLIVLALFAVSCDRIVMDDLLDRDGMGDDKDRDGDGDRDKDRDGDDKDRDHDGDDKRDMKCFKLLNPSYEMPDGTIITGETGEDIDAAIKRWHEANPDSRGKAVLIFPVDVIMADGTTKSIGSPEEMKALEMRCKKDSGNDDWDGKDKKDWDKKKGKDKHHGDDEDDEEDDEDDDDEEDDEDEPQANGNTGSRK
jgi:hypothetical protein